ncbi:glutathione synthase [Acanthopleuribacter pedis]|uniref:Glutathione synthetase n=1 Tax=Acanthopleuribacter pedis TaxID=442870 RepID=A0A8J7QB97_9BACT|nr:glutathione synthase [Acanthopleuribacter pedis]
MKFAFIMDPLEQVKAYKDTSYHLMLAAAERGHEVYYLDQNWLFAHDGALFSEVIPVQVHADHDQPFEIGERVETRLDVMDVVLVRTDPPFDRRYFYTTLLLDLLPKTTRVVNRPQGLRNWNEKLSALFFMKHSPSTLVASSIPQIRKYIEARAQRVTLKPVDGHGGRGILFVDKNDTNLDQLLLMATHDGAHRVIAQEYVPGAKDGDKRILLLNGEPMGAILRLHQEGKELNNMDAGGTPHPWKMTEREHEICREMGPALREQGILFAGIDILGDQLIEINVTSPTGLQELCRFDDVPFNHRIVEAMETWEG